MKRLRFLAIILAAALLLQSGGLAASFSDVLGIVGGDLIAALRPEGTVSPEPTPSPTIPPEFILLDAHEMAIGLGEGARLGYVRSPGSAGWVRFSSSDSNIAAVDDEGNISALRIGEAIITAETESGCSDSCRVRVCPLPEEIALHIASTELGLNETARIEVEFLPEGSMASLRFSSSNKNYISVNQSGEVTALRKKAATITAETSNGVSAKLKLSVVDAPKSIKLELSSDAIAVGAMAFALCTFPQGSGGGYVLSTDSPELIRLGQDGAITGLSNGTATITATAYNGVKSSAQLTVLSVPEEIFVNPEMKMSIGSTAYLNCALPEDSSSPLFFQSLNPDCVTVDSASGLLTALKLGEAEIRIFAINSPATAQCRILVLPAPEEMIPSQTEITLYEGQTYALECAFLPEGSYSALSYAPENPRIVGVDEFGDILALAPGSTSVEVSTCNGLRSSVLVHVLEAPKWIKLSSDHLNLHSGETFALEYVLPAGSQTSVRFASSNPEVAAVDEVSGLVTALSTGTAVITATMLNGEFASCTVNVNIGLDSSETVSGDLEIIFMDIGRNDGILISCGGEYAFIDSGYYRYGVEAVEFMQKLGVEKLKYYIGSHAHKDHIGGAGPILAAIPTEMIVVPHEYCIDCMLEFCKTAGEKAAIRNTPKKIFTLGQQIYLGGARISCLGPVNYEYFHYSVINENGNSLVMRITYGSNSFLFTGDATKAEMTAIEKYNPGCLSSDLFKNPHHNQAQDVSVIEKIQPLVTIFSTSNSAWPKQSYVSALRKLGSEIYCTASGANGVVRVSSNGSGIVVKPQRGQALATGAVREVS